MTLCIWTSLHLNLPEHKEEGQVLRKAKWLMLGLLAPEIVVWNAWRQRRVMRQLSRQMRNDGLMAEEINAWTKIRSSCRKRFNTVCVLLRIPAKAEPSQENTRYKGRKNAWTDVHSWYVTMGGLAFEDATDEELRFMPGKRQRATLTANGVRWLAEHRLDVLPDISKQHIEDKSKADGLAKAFTFWQAAYFCIQCTFRIHEGSSITLLELNVFAHALCALLLLTIWWDKPRDVREPTLITDNRGLDACAMFYLKRDRDSPQGPYKGGDWIPREPRSGFLDVEQPTFVPVHAWRDFPNADPYFAWNATDLMSELKPGYEFLLCGPMGQPGIKVVNTFWTIKAWNENIIHDSSCRIDSRTIQRLARAYRVFQDADFHCNFFQTLIVDRYQNSDSALLFGHVEDWFSRSFAAWLATGLTFAGGCYGGLHLVAWANKFPSNAETILWQAASVTLAVTGPLAMVVYLVWFLALGGYSDSVGPGSFLGYLIAWVLGIVLALWYPICRAFIVVECFIMLAHVPDTALQVPTWAAYIPHFA